MGENLCASRPLMPLADPVLLSRGVGARNWSTQEQLPPRCGEPNSSRATGTAVSPPAVSSRPRLAGSPCLHTREERRRTGRSPLTLRQASASPAPNGSGDVCSPGNPLDERETATAGPSSSPRPRPTTPWATQPSRCRGASSSRTASAAAPASFTSAGERNRRARSILAQLDAPPRAARAASVAASQAEPVADRAAPIRQVTVLDVTSPVHDRPRSTQDRRDDAGSARPALSAPLLPTAHQASDAGGGAQDARPPIIPAQAEPWPTRLQHLLDNTCTARLADLLRLNDDPIPTLAAI